MVKQLLLASLLFVPLAAAEEPDHAIHQELRGILTTVQSAVNSGNYDAMLPVLSKDIRATTITQESFSGHAGVSAYFKKWFGPGGFLKKLEMKLTADDLTELSADKTWGIVRGSATETYTLADGRVYPMPTRWTATVAKEPDGHWRLRAIHFGTNFLDNPILDEAKRKAKQYTAAGAGGGLLAGLLLGFLFGRRK
ncbi:MAG TPA: nuclear transport factor 2 family protein [Thermoanaerobaculia bacterium]|nr:nuclear transport factor 2 family protein [Thermoanaerobaculia bacterium]